MESVELPERMNDDVIVTLRDDRSVNLYRIRGRDNLFIRSVQITSTGKIIGSPVQSGNRCIITYEEKSGNFIRVMQNSYELPQFRLIKALSYHSVEKYNDRQNSKYKRSSRVIASR